MVSDDIQKDDIKLCKRRWVFLATLCVQQALFGISASLFGQINNFFVAYFRVSYTQVDWMTISMSLAPIVVTLPLAWLTFKRIVGFKFLAIFCAITSTIGFGCFAISMASRNLFAVSVVGQIMNGVGTQVITATPPTFAALWFQENEVGTAIAINTVGVFFGYLIGFLVPSHILTLRIDNTTSQIDGDWLERDKRTLIWIYLACVAVSVIIGTILSIFATDLPPKPPTYAQKIKRLDLSKPPNSEFWPQTKSVLCSKTFVLACLVFAIVFQAPTVEFIMMSQIIKQFSLAHGLSLNYDVIGVYVMCSYSLGNIFGTLVGGKLVDKFKRYDILSMVGMAFSFLATLIVVLGVFFAQDILLYVGNALMGTFRQITFVAVYDISTQQTYPIDETFVTIWLVGIIMPMGAVYGEIGRAIFISLGGLGVVIFQCSNFFLGTIFACLFSPIYKRIDIKETSNDYNGNNSLETTSLISDRNHN